MCFLIARTELRLSIGEERRGGEEKEDKGDKDERTAMTVEARKRKKMKGGPLGVAGRVLQLSTNCGTISPSLYSRTCSSTSAMLGSSIW